MWIAIASIIDDNYACKGIRVYEAEKKSFKDIAYSEVLKVCRKDKNEISNISLVGNRLRHSHLQKLNMETREKQIGDAVIYTALNIKSGKVTVISYNGSELDIDRNEIDEYRIGNSVELENMLMEYDEEHSEDKEEHEEIEEETETKEQESEDVSTEEKEICPKCGGKGWYTTDFGLRITCSCKVEAEQKEKEKELQKKEKPVYFVNNAQKEIVATKNLVPENRIDDDYSEEVSKQNIVNICGQLGAQACEFKKYSETLNTIITNISLGIKLPMSYILGAPNGFGKTTFANTCIKKLDASGKRAAPYISLYELAEIKAKYEVKLFKSLRGDKLAFEKSDEDFEYEWEDYMKADVLFVHMTTLDNKVIESKILKIILSIRGTKGLPTVVFMEESLVPYKKDKELKAYIWDEIEALNKLQCSYDRVYHVSCYKMYSNGYSAKKGSDY